MVIFFPLISLKILLNNYKLKIFVLLPPMECVPHFGKHCASDGVDGRLVLFLTSTLTHVCYLHLINEEIEKIEQLSNLPRVMRQARTYLEQDPCYSQCGPAV